VDACLTFFCFTVFCMVTNDFF